MHKYLTPKDRSVPRMKRVFVAKGSEVPQSPEYYCGACGNRLSIFDERCDICGTKVQR